MGQPINHEQRVVGHVEHRPVEVLLLAAGIQPGIPNQLNHQSPGLAGLGRGALPCLGIK